MSIDSDDLRESLVRGHTLTLTGEPNGPGDQGDARDQEQADTNVSLHPIGIGRPLWDLS